MVILEKDEGLLAKTSVDVVEQLPNDASNIVKIIPPDAKPIRVDYECLYLTNPLYHEEHNFFGSSICSYYSMIWNEISEIAGLHGWLRTIYFLLLHLIIIMPIKILLNPPFIPRKWKHEFKVEIQLPPFPGYTDTQRWCFARKLWFNHKGEQIFDERDGVKVWEGFCFSENEYSQIREYVWSRISYFVERTGFLKAALSHGLKETDLTVAEDTGLWVSHMAIGNRCLRLMTFADAKSIPGRCFLIRYKWWQCHVFNGWARVHATVPKTEVPKSPEEKVVITEEKGIMVVMHLYVLPCFKRPFKKIIKIVFGLYFTQLKEIIDICC